MFTWATILLQVVAPGEARESCQRQRSRHKLSVEMQVHSPHSALFQAGTAATDISSGGLEGGLWFQKGTPVANCRESCGVYLIDAEVDPRLRGM